MNKTASAQRGVILVSLALLLAMLVMGTWVNFGPVWPSEYIKFKVVDTAIFALTCISMTLVILGARDIQKAGESCSTTVLVMVSVLANAIVLFYALYELITGSAGTAIRQ
jgi:hypothetical protein